MNKVQWFILLLACMICISLAACTPIERMPQSGTWYCSELQAQLTIYPNQASLPYDYLLDNDESGNYVIVNGDKIACTWGNDRGSPIVYIMCQESDNPHYGLGEFIYALEFVRLSDSEYVLKDKRGKEYTFVRTD